MLFHISEFTGLNLGYVRDFPKIFRDFTQFHHENFGLVFKIILQLFPSHSLQFHDSLFISRAVLNARVCVCVCVCVCLCVSS